VNSGMFFVKTGARRARDAFPVAAAAAALAACCGKTWPEVGLEAAFPDLVAGFDN